MIQLIQKNRFILVLPIILFIWGCGKPTPKYNPKKVTGHEIVSLIDSYINGDEKAENRLKDPFELNILDAKRYRKVEIDSLQIDGVTYFGILLQHKQPENNKFLIYDDTLGLLLHDKSLSGSLNYKQVEVGTKQFFSVIQKYSVKNIVNVEYLKIYDIKSNRASIAFENYTEVSSPTLLAKMNTSFSKGNPLKLNFKLWGNTSVFKPLDVEYKDSDGFSTKAEKWRELLHSYTKGYQTSEKITPIAEELPKYYNTRFDLLRMYLPAKWEIKNGVEIKSLFEDKVTGTVVTREKKDITIFVFDLEGKSPVRKHIKDINFNLISDEYNYSLYDSKLIKKESDVTQFLLSKCENEEYLVAIRCDAKFYDNNYPLIYYMINSINVNCY
ncbi:hypothetical protein MASR2M39_06490 [Ignavibacteriales bacterium]